MYHKPLKQKGQLMNLQKNKLSIKMYLMNFIGNM